MLKEFKAFVLRGNAVDLAVGVVIGAAFGTIVNSLVGDILTPLLGLASVPDFSGLTVDVGEDQIRYGEFLNAIVSFFLVASAIFFFVVRPVNHLMGRGREEPPKMRECPHCLTSIPIAARVCAHCTRDVGEAVGGTKRRRPADS